MFKSITSTELHQNTLDVIERVDKDEAIVIETNGKPVAALLSFAEYQQYLELRKARTERFKRLHEAAAQNAAFNQLTEEEAMALVEQVREEVYWEANKQNP